MEKLRQLLSIVFVYSTLFIGCAFAQTNLTQILDTVYNADKSLFNGTLIISWNGFTGPAGSTIAPHSTSTQILNGALSVFLVPSTTASPGAYYLATYNSSDGTVTWTETWQVPPSTTPLTLNQVRQPAGTTSGNGGGGSGGGGGTVYATLPISIDEVTGLGSDLDAINGSLTSFTTTVNGVSATVTSLGSTVSGFAATVNGNSSSITALTATVTALSSTVTALSKSVATLTAIVNGLASGSNAIFVDAETPAGTIDGAEATFTLTATPAPTASLSLYRNGLVQTNGIDYTLAGMAITFVSGNIPQPGDILQAYYRTAVTGPAPSLRNR